MIVLSNRMHTLGERRIDGEKAKSDMPIPPFILSKMQESFSSEIWSVRERIAISGGSGKIDKFRPPKMGNAYQMGPLRFLSRKVENDGTSEGF